MSERKQTGRMVADGAAQLRDVVPTAEVIVGDEERRSGRDLDATVQAVRAGTAQTMLDAIRAVAESGADRKLGLLAAGDFEPGGRGPQPVVSARGDLGERPDGIESVEREPRQPQHRR